MQIPEIPKELKLNKDNLPAAGAIYREEQTVFFIDSRVHPNGMEYPEEGGIWIHKFGADMVPTGNPGEFSLENIVPLLYPQKGFPEPGSVQAANFVKRILITQIRFLFKSRLIFMALFVPNKIRMINEWMQEFNSLCYGFMYEHYLEDNYYLPVSRNLGKLVREFLMSLGTDRNITRDFAMNLCLLIELDDAYRLRIEDIMSETTQGKLENPSEITRLISIFNERDSSDSTKEKFGIIMKVLRYLLYIPKFKNAWVKAVRSIDFPKIQLDEIDRYHVLRMNDRYKFMGKPAEERFAEYLRLHNNNPPKAYTIVS